MGYCLVGFGLMAGIVLSANASELDAQLPAQFISASLPTPIIDKMGRAGIGSHEMSVWVKPIGGKNTAYQPFGGYTTHPSVYPKTHYDRCRLGCDGGGLSLADTAIH